ncbi:aldose 1-epimerase [Ramlibacter solisilvae]|uniref:Aldose 1-epimerase n=1 Tax=Ramlibacter tataouinensis TaxID=94132 RepID=A0A127JRM4_9BURK|nr:hypothetical protein [Ramlibacter tataouinensis]AMO22565.1 hypothetical protein UC35_06290 [Ramlibacter tataouinensis]
MIELRAGALRCQLLPQLGGCIAGLWLQDQPVLRSMPVAELSSARQSGCYPLVPYSNRIGHARLVWQGTLHPLVRNDSAEPHAIHGIGWQRPWSVLEQDEASIMLACEHRPDPTWPFGFDCSHMLRLTPAGLEMTLAATNQSAQPAPMGLGWHPNFVKRPGARIAFHATGRWEMGTDMLPTRREPAGGLDQPCETLAVDHCFDGWDGQAKLTDPVMRVTVQSELTRAVVFCSPVRDYLAIEPVTHVNNALQLHAAGLPASELGVVVLPPGESMLAQMRILVEPA